MYVRLVVTGYVLIGSDDSTYASFSFGDTCACVQTSGIAVINREVERLLKIEQKVTSIPSVLPVGPICLHTNPIRDALHGFAMAWKNQYASVLHEEAKVCSVFIWTKSKIDMIFSLVFVEVRVSCRGS